MPRVEFLKSVAWEESKHPRLPEGDAHGGEWTSAPIGAAAQGLLDAGGVLGSERQLAPHGGADHAHGERPLHGLTPRKIKIPGLGEVEVGPDARARKVARDYMKKAGLPYHPPTEYAKVDPARAKRIADAYDAMPHAPHDPKVKASYDAMIHETHEQFKAVQASGLKVEFIKAGQTNPYATSPRLATEDVRRNNHLWVYPTSSGFGSREAMDVSNNPLLRETGAVVGGHRLVANDEFRVVHDYFGHIKEGNGFRADGEENAWRSHVAMFSEAARPAMTAETRGQNSWVNYGPFGEQNRSANSDHTVFADQKAGLLPEWTWREGSGVSKANTSKAATMSDMISLPRAVYEAFVGVFAKSDPTSGDVHEPVPMGAKKPPVQGKKPRFGAKAGEADPGSDPQAGDRPRWGELPPGHGEAPPEGKDKDKGKGNPFAKAAHVNLDLAEPEEFVITKVAEDQRMVYGWASVISDSNGPLVDTQGDVIASDELERATTDFMKDVRHAADMHPRNADKTFTADLAGGSVVHSFPLTKALAEGLGIDSEREGWIVGVHVAKDDTWARVKSGELRAFSIGGAGRRTPVDL